MKISQQHMVDIKRTASVISTQRSYADLIFKIKKILPEFMGFDGIGILFRDTKTDNLFTISDTIDEADLRMIKEHEEKLKRGELLSEDDKLVDFERQFREKAMHVYPNTLGVTGQVF